MYDYDWLSMADWVVFWQPFEIRLIEALELYRATGDYFPDYTQEHIEALFPKCEN